MVIVNINLNLKIFIMANVIIQLRVDIEQFMNGDNPDYKKACRLAQFGGEDIGNYLSVDFTNSYNTSSVLTLNDVVTWVGVAANFTNSNPDTTYGVDIIAIKNPTEHPDIFGNHLNNRTTGFGLTVISNLVNLTPPDEYAAYTIQFNITENDIPIWNSPYTFDPKISVKAP